MIRSNRLERSKNGFVKDLRLLRSYLLLASLTVILTTGIAASNSHEVILSAHKELEASKPPAAPCDSVPPSVVSLRCVNFEGHLYAVADIHLQSQRIIFTASEDSKMEAFPEVVSHLASAGVKPLLVTNAGIYGTDNRPLG
jgi:hypothetical protein